MILTKNRALRMSALKSGRTHHITATTTATAARRRRRNGTDIAETSDSETL